jgi:hypothetical protein
VVGKAKKLFKMAQKNEVEKESKTQLERESESSGGLNQKIDFYEPPRQLFRKKIKVQLRKDGEI